MYIDEADYFIPVLIKYELLKILKGLWAGLSWKITNPISQTLETNDLLVLHHLPDHLRCL